MNILTPSRPDPVTDLGTIRDIISQNQGLSRYKISRKIAEHWNWTNASGVLKDMSCRNLLKRLEEKGHIQLPPRRHPGCNRMHRQRIAVTHSIDPINTSLRELGTVSLRVVHRNDPDDVLALHLLETYHYLGYSYTVGENLKYVVRDGQGRVLAVAVWGSAALKVKPRDDWLGWDESTRMSQLHLVVNNTRYLILPWVRVPHLASHILGRMVRRLSSDWSTRYGHPVHLAETFVDHQRYPGTCYRAANWLPLGITTGRTRHDRYKTMHVPSKLQLVLPLIPEKDMRATLACRGTPRQEVHS
jgi:hypothetical protein